MKNFSVKGDANLVENEASAGIAKNVLTTLMKFVLTDDLPNLNKQRVPKEEFKNLITSGLYMPIKIAGGIFKNHKDAFPIGVITELQEEGNKIIGLATLWDKERPEDVEMIKKLFAEKRPLNLSWEINYSDSTVDDEGVESIANPILRAVTLVDIPAYGGRTPVLALASREKVDKILNIVSSLEIPDVTKKEIQAELEELTVGEEVDEAKLKAKEEELAELDDIKKLADDLQKEVVELKASNEKLTGDLAAKNTEVTTLSEKVASLESFKSDVEKKEQEATKFEEIKQKFASLKVNKDEKYFTDNRDTLLALNPEQLDFMLQGMIAYAEDRFASASTDEKKHIKIPNIPGEKGQPSTDPKELGRQMRESLNSK
jgi:hypothetical protein